MNDGKQQPAEAPTCEVTEKVAPRVFEPCGMPATTKATEPPGWFLCAEHTKFALVAGWKPRNIEEVDA